MSRDKIKHINKDRSFHGFVSEIDTPIIKEVLNKFATKERNVYKYIGAGAFWNQTQLHDIGANDKQDLCQHCGACMTS